MESFQGREKWMWVGLRRDLIYTSGVKKAVGMVKRTWQLRAGRGRNVAALNESKREGKDKEIRVDGR